MKSVGIKNLKNSLSRYLDMVRAGETIWITDREEIIAELRMPTQAVVNRASPWVAFLEEQARRGTLRLAKRKRSRLMPAARRSGLDAVRLLNVTRADKS